MDIYNVIYIYNIIYIYVILYIYILYQMYICIQLQYKYICIQYMYIYRLVVWNMTFMTFQILGMSSSPLTLKFFRGVETTNQYIYTYKDVMLIIDRV